MEPSVWRQAAQQAIDVYDASGGNLDNVRKEMGWRHHAVHMGGVESPEVSTGRAARWLATATSSRTGQSSSAAAAAAADDDDSDAEDTCMDAENT